MSSRLWKGISLWVFLPALVYSINHPIVADGTMSVNGSISSMKLSVVRSLRFSDQVSQEGNNTFSKQNDCGVNAHLLL